MQEIKASIEGFLKLDYGDKVRMKYEWLKNYYNDVITDLHKIMEFEFEEFEIKDIN